MEMKKSTISTSKDSEMLLKTYPPTIVKSINSGDHEEIHSVFEAHLHPNCKLKSYCTDDVNPHGPMAFQLLQREMLEQYFYQLTQAIPDFVMTYSEIRHATYKSLRKQLLAKKLDINSVTMEQGAITCTSYAYKVTGTRFFSQDCALSRIENQAETIESFTEVLRKQKRSSSSNTTIDEKAEEALTSRVSDSDVNYFLNFVNHVGGPDSAVDQSELDSAIDADAGGATKKQTKSSDSTSVSENSLSKQNSASSGLDTHSKSSSNVDVSSNVSGKSSEVNQEHFNTKAPFSSGSNFPTTVQTENEIIISANLEPITFESLQIGLKRKIELATQTKVRIVGRSVLHTNEELKVVLFENYFSYKE